MAGQSSVEFTAFHGLFIAINTARLQQKKITPAAEKFCLFCDKTARRISGQPITLQNSYTLGLATREKLHLSMP
jgi:hypothetical protein